MNSNNIVITPLLRNNLDFVKHIWLILDAAPKNFIHMFMGRATNFAVFGWEQSNSAVSYTIRIYRYVFC